MIFDKDAKIDVEADDIEIATVKFNFTTTTSPLALIRELSAYRTRWAIKARVTTKSYALTWRSGIHYAMFFHADFLDAAGGEIRATFYDSAVGSYYNMPQVWKVFTFG